MSEKLYWLGFSVFPGVGPVLFRLLLEAFGNAEAAWNASGKDLNVILKNKLTTKFISFREQFSPEKYEEVLDAKNVWFVTLEEKEYPQLLKKIENPPFVLYGIGSISILHQIQDDPSARSGQARYIGVVGTRKITSYGREVTVMITRDLVDGGCVIVSGLALGVDAVAHTTTMQSGGKTIAVLGCGVDLCYPTTNQGIYNSILASGGAIVSEYPVGQQPTIGSFPARNRIIAGLSDAVVVTEGAEDSGAMITAEEALKNERLVFAVPGPITSGLSKGPLRLLQQGAKIATGGGDILSELGISKYEVRSKQRVVKGETKEEQEIIDLLQNDKLLFDEIVSRTKVPAPILSMTLSLMEIKGIVRKTEGRFGLAQEHDH